MLPESFETPKFSMPSHSPMDEVYAMKERDIETARQALMQSQEQALKAYDGLAESINERHEALMRIAAHADAIDGNVAELKSDVSSIENKVASLNNCVETLKSDLAEERARAEKAEKSAKWFGFWCGIGAIVLTILLEWAFDTFIEPAISNHLSNAATIFPFHFLF